MKNILQKLGTILIVAALFTSCAVVRPGQVGFKQRLGALKGNPIQPGLQWFNPFTSTIIRINTRTVELFTTLHLPTKEGLSVNTDISLLYHINPDSAKSVYVHFGTNYEEIMVLSNFRATAREVSARYYAKELYATERDKVEKAILSELDLSIRKYGFIVDAVLLKDINLPDQMSKAIEDKVTAEQAALQMDFVIQKQKKEAERLIIEAEGIKKSQEIINSSLTPNILTYNQIEMLRSLVNSNNSKIIITDGKSTPVLLNTNGN